MDNTTAEKNSEIGSLPPIPSFLSFYVFLARERAKEETKE